MLSKIFIGLVSASLIVIATIAQAATVTIPVHLVTSTDNGIGKAIGSITATDTDHGLLLTPNLNDLSPGIHGMHIHLFPNCGPKAENDKLVPGGAAGGHLDPNNTNKHLGPYNNQGHLGDLPFIYVNPQGKATHPVLAPRLSVFQIRGHSIIIHAGGDNYSDKPKPLGGGGARIACGIIPSAKFAN